MSRAQTVRRRGSELRAPISFDDAHEPRRQKISFVAVRTGCALLCVLAGCARKPSPTSSEHELVVSVGGAVTEIVFALGAGSRVVGVDAHRRVPVASRATP